MLVSVKKRRRKILSKWKICFFGSLTDLRILGLMAGICFLGTTFPSFCYNLAVWSNMAVLAWICPSFKDKTASVQYSTLQNSTLQYGSASQFVWANTGNLQQELMGIGIVQTPSPSWTFNKNKNKTFKGIQQHKTHKCARSSHPSPLLPFSPNQECV